MKYHCLGLLALFGCAHIDANQATALHQIPLPPITNSLNSDSTDKQTVLFEWEWPTELKSHTFYVLMNPFTSYASVSHQWLTSLSQSTSERALALWQNAYPNNTVLSLGLLAPATTASWKIDTHVIRFEGGWHQPVQLQAEWQISSPHHCQLQAKASWQADIPATGYASIDALLDDYRRAVDQLVLDWKATWQQDCRHGDIIWHTCQKPESWIWVTKDSHVAHQCQWRILADHATNARP